MSANPLIGYAFLKVNFSDHVHDLLDLTLPLTRRALHRWQESDITTEALQRKIEDIWGMVIPQHVLRYLLPKLRDLGMVSFDPETKKYKIQNTKYAEKESEIIKKENEAHDIYNRTLQKINTELLREGIRNISGRSILETFLDGGALSFISRDNPSTHARKEDEVAARIIARVIGAADENPDEIALKDLEDLVMGDILYKAIFAISEGDAFDAISGKMKDVKVFLDTGVLFRCLGYFGSIFERPAQEMLEIFKATGCNLHTFEHNVDEVALGLRAVADRLYTGGAYGPIVSFVIESGLDRIDLIELAGTLSEKLTAQGIIISPLPQMTKDLSISEAELDWRIEFDVKQNNPLARRRDVDSLAGIYRLRDGKPQKNLESCPAIFVTSNKSLADASTKYFQALFKEEGQRNVVQICMTDVVLTTRLWLKVPTKFKGVPRNQILVHALSSLRPSAEVLSKFVDIIRKRVEDRRINTELAIEVSFSNLVRSILALETNNDPRQLSEEIVDQIIATGIKEVRSQKKRLMVEATAMGERAAELDAMKEIAKLQHRLEHAVANSATSERERDLAQQTVEYLSREIEALRASRIVADRLSEITARFILFLGWLVLICGIGSPLLTVLFPNLTKWWTLQLIGALVAVFLSVLTIIGGSYFDFLRRLDRWVFMRWRGFFLALLEKRNENTPRYEPKI